MAVEVRPGTELRIVASGGDYAFQLSTICTRVAEYVRTASVPLEIRSCDLRYDWSPEGIITNGYTGTWIVSPTVSFATSESVRDMLAGALRVATGRYPAEIGIAEIGGVSTGSTVPADPAPSVIGGIGDFLTGLSSALPWLAIAIVALLVLVLLTNAAEFKKALRFA